MSVSVNILHYFKNLHRIILMYHYLMILLLLAVYALSRFVLL